MEVVQCLIVLIVFTFCAADPLVRYQPEQIHLSLGGKSKFLTNSLFIIYTVIVQFVI